MKRLREDYHHEHNVDALRANYHWRGVDPFEGLSLSCNDNLVPDILCVRLTIYYSWDSITNAGLDTRGSYDKPKPGDRGPLFTQSADQIAVLYVTYIAPL